MTRPPVCRLDVTVRQREGDSLLLEVKEGCENSSNTLGCNDISQVPQVAPQVVRKGPAHSER